MRRYEILHPVLDRLSLKTNVKKKSFKNSLKVRFCQSKNDCQKV